MGVIQVDMDALQRRCKRLCANHISVWSNRCENCPLYKKPGCSYANWPSTGDIESTLKILDDEGIDDVRGIGEIRL